MHHFLPTPKRAVASLLNTGRSGPAASRDRTDKREHRFYAGRIRFSSSCDINDLIEKGALVRDLGGGRSTSYSIRQI